MTAEAELHEGLRRVAARLDAAVAEDARATAPSVRREPAAPPRARALLAAAAAIALLVGVLALVVSDDEDESVRTDVPTSTVIVPEPDATVDPDGPETVQTPPETTVSTPAVPPSYEGLPWEQLPAHGMAVVDGGRVALLDSAGAELGSFATSDVPLIGSVEEARLLIRPGVAVDVVSDVVEDGDCRVTGANGSRVARCGPEQGTLVLLRPTGEAVPLAGMALDAESGRWRSGQVSPDGRWVLAQWSGECEASTAFLVRSDGADLRTADGFTTFPGEPPFPASSGVVGWTADGRAIVVFEGSPACGNGTDEPGTYLIDPDTGARTKAAVGARFGQIPWERIGTENDRERALLRAASELGLETCCGEPAHGGSGVTSGVVWDGIDVTIGGGAVGPVTVAAGEGELGAVGADSLDGLPVVTATLDGRALLAFTCGATRWVLGGAPSGRGAVPDGALLRDVASALIPRLYCTVGEPPVLRSE